MPDITEPIVSLRRLARVAPTLLAPVLVSYDQLVIGRYAPFATAPRSAQDSGDGPSAVAAPVSSPEATGAPARTRAPRSQAKRDAVLRRVNRTGSER